MSHRPQESESGVAGRSAWREHARRADRTAQPGSARHRLLKALLGPTAREKRQLLEDRQWAVGARGEELLAESLARRCPEVLLLHDRGMPGSRANIDHIAIAPSGVYVIDTKRYRGKIEILRPLFGSPKLKISGRDRTKLVDGLALQVAAVEAALADIAPEIPVRGCLCFVAPEGFLADVGLPLFRTLKINGCELYYPRRLAGRLNRKGPVLADRALAVRAELARRLPAA